MIYLLDTNTCIGWLRNSEPKIIARIQQENPADLVLCSVVVGELVYGAERAGPVYHVANLNRVGQLRAQFVSLSFDDNAAEEYGKLRAYLAANGKLIGPNDLMIAAIALANRVTLITHNTSEFQRVPGLLFEDWQ